MGMKNRWRSIVRALPLLLCLLLSISPPGYCAAAPSAEAFPGLRLPTPSETRNFNGLTGNSELWDFLRNLSETSPAMKLCVMGRTALGAPIPLLIISDPPLYFPWQSRMLNRPIIYIQGGIHGNEPAATEGILLWLAELAAANRGGPWEQAIFLVAPRVNLDGFAQGTRDSAGRYDLNRDYVKLDSPETRAIVEQVLVSWQPDLFIDLHESGPRGYDYMLEGAQGPLADPGIAAF